MTSHPEKFPREPKKRSIVRATLLTSFFAKKSHIDFSKPTRLNADLRNLYGASKKNIWFLTLPPKVLDMAWESAFYEILSIAKENIKRVATRPGKIVILLTGGSMGNQRAREDIEQFCRGPWDGQTDITCMPAAKCLEIVSRYVIKTHKVQVMSSI